MTIKLYSSSVREAGPRDINGATSVVIGEKETLFFEGNAKDAAEKLRSIPVGTSVAVRHPGGLRSCMNKPDLWEWVAALDNPSIIKRGGFNTGRLYRDHGQHIYFWQTDNGWLIFRDRSRMVGGFYRRDPDSGVPKPREIMAEYDAGNFQHWRPDDLPPEMDWMSRELPDVEGVDMDTHLRI